MNGKHDRRRGGSNLLLAWILAGSLLAAGCGQRGPLVLPPPPEPPRLTEPVAPATATPDAGVPGAVDRPDAVPRRP